MQMIDPEALLSGVGLSVGGVETWKDSIPEKGPGVYIISIQRPDAIAVDSLPAEHQSYWKGDQAIVYIGRSKHLRRRLREFYKHKYGEKRPHAGGQAILNLSLQTVHWASVSDYHKAEGNLIEAFEKAAGAKPFGNRVRSAQPKTSK